MLDKELPGWKRKYYPLIGLDPKPLTKEAQEKIEEMLEWMRTQPNTDNADDDIDPIQNRFITRFINKPDLMLPNI
ncbi:MAG: hypothetical protein WBZ36_29695, partial [Candidatus Nitrosopolaris sp.]